MSRNNQDFIRSLIYKINQRSYVIIVYRYKKTFNASKSFCNLMASMSPEFDTEHKNYNQMNSDFKDRIAANRQNFIEYCMESNLNLYFDTSQHLVISYGN